MEQTPEISTGMVTGGETDAYHGCDQDRVGSCHHIHHHIHHHYHHHQSLGYPIADNAPTQAPPNDRTPSAPPIDVHFQTKELYLINCKSDPNFFLSVRDGEVILAPFHLDDESQWWYKKQFNIAEDKMGQPAFALVNQATNQAMKHSFGHSHPEVWFQKLLRFASSGSTRRFRPTRKKVISVQLITYNPYVVDESIMWTQCKDDLGDGYRSIRMIDNTDLSMDATAANINGVTDGMKVILWKWNAGSNQQWLMTPI